MKKKQLEILLERIPQPKNPSPNKEQYMTPASIASDILYIAHQFNDISDKTLLDLGCGTGVFSVGASLIGAKKIFGIDFDKELLHIAQTYAQENNLDIEYKLQDVKNVTISCDTLIMNPPFGAQKSNQKADRTFIEKGFELATVIYSLHLKKTIPFIKQLCNALEGTITYQKEYVFPIKWMFSFHKKAIKNFDVTLLRIEP